MLSSQTQMPSVQIPAAKDIHRPARSFSWKGELNELFSVKFFNFIWWPVFKFRQRRFSHSSFIKECKTLPGFKSLWTTIQKGSFAYNCLFLGLKPYRRSSSSTDLVDITTLALFFGDEFIDGVCKAAGKETMRDLLESNPKMFYLKREMVDSHVQLVYHFDMNELMPEAVMKQITPKYGIDYKKFYSLLQHFLQIMNCYLAELSFAKAQSVADKIADVCNTCLESYIHDIGSDPVAGQIREASEVLHFHETKTRYMQEKFLELRCILARKEYLMKTPQKQGWLDIMRIVQVYDDLQDVLEDDGYQDNLVISVAFHKFREEWEWLKKNEQLLQQSQQKHFLLSLFIPQTIHYCLQIATGRMKSMNWEQEKIMHYLLFKNWFVAEGKEGISRFFTFPLDQEVFIKLYHQLQFMMPGSNADEIKSHLINSCFHLKPIKQILKKNLGWTTYYQLRYNLLTTPVEIKTKAFDKICQVNFKSI